MPKTATKTPHAADCVDGSTCGETAHCPPDALETAQAAFVAGLVHSTLAQGGWTIHEAAPAEGRCTVGCAKLFGPGVVADVTVTIRKVDEL